MKLGGWWPGRRLGLVSQGVGAAMTPRLCSTPDCRPFIVQQKGWPPPDTWSRLAGAGLAEDFTNINFATALMTNLLDVM